MLSESTKNRFCKTLAEMEARFPGMNQEKGPAKIIDLLIENKAPMGSVARADTENVEQNREEAERYVAGLLGMM